MVRNHTRDKVEILNNFQELDGKPKVLNEESKDATEIYNSNFASFLEEVQSDYQNANQLLRILLDNGTHIHVQVESIKQYNIKQKPVVENKENETLDPNIIST
ncbi:31581_t:CDS:2, partial [Gigaspora margarita]